MKKCVWNKLQEHRSLWQHQRLQNNFIRLLCEQILFNLSVHW